MGEKKLREVVLESGVEVKPIYGPEDVADIDFEREIGEPGAYPFTRGIHKYMYRYRPWTMRQYAGFGTPRESNERFKYLIDHGQNALNVAFDLPSQMGLDSDHPLAWGEVGRVGMAVDSLQDMEEAFEGIPLDKISTSLTINSVATIMMAMYFVVAEKQGVPLQELRGTAQNDILKEYIGRGTWIFPVEPSIRLIGDTIEFCAEHVPYYYPVSVCGYHIRESGANPVQEIAYAYAIASAYIEHVRERGLDVDDFVARLSFNFDIWGNIFEQVAKFRAARRLWAKIVRDKFGATDPGAMQMKMIAGGGGGGLTIEQPENNIVRGAYYALISALSGTQTMALCTYDEAYTIPTEKAALIGLRTMQILAEEMGLCDTVDPLAGSYYIERLTTDLEKKIVEEIERVERMGGIVKAISEGLIQREVAGQAYRYEQGIQSGEIVKVGV
ncbi:MAG TPA: methylmalonyl-CoA mutase family protein, partial [Anaerolineae bacterium]|nr:methylmalonyl-CoA mutase family protein [Anaerolineae bacterium]